MGAIYDQMQLRMSPNFRDFIHTAIMAVAVQVQNEPESTQFHDARVAMADLIIQTQDPKVDDFVSRVTFLAVMDDTIRGSVVKNGSMALEFANEDAVLDGIAMVWNGVCTYVWPTIVEDTAEPVEE